MNYMQLGRTDSFPRPVGDRLQLDRRAGDLSEQLVRVVALALSTTARAGASPASRFVNQSVPKRSLR